MTEPEPILDLLVTDINPVDQADLELPVESQRAQDLYARITGTPYAGKPPRKNRRPWMTAGIAALLLLLGIGAERAYAGFSSNHVAEHLAVLCYSQPYLNSKAAAVNATLDGPIASCAEAWAAGQVGTGKTPLLAACVTHQGVTAVFPSAPGADVCAQNGLEALPAGATSLAAATTTVPAAVANPPGSLTPQLRDAIVAQLQEHCQSADQAKIAITDLLANGGLHWSVVEGPFSPARPCASPAFDEQDHKLYLVGIPPLGATPGGSTAKP
jgi:hypothetical protein